MISTRERSLVLFFILLIAVLELLLISEKVSLRYVPNSLSLNDNAPLVEKENALNNNLIIWTKQAIRNDTTILSGLKRSNVNLYQVDNVQFKIGRPNNTSFDDTSSQELYLYCNDKNNHVCSKVSELIFEEATFVTHWNETLQANRKLNVTNVRVVQCSDKKTTCPKKICPFEYVWDPIDDICKTTAPKRRPFVGSCEECKTTCFTPDAMRTDSTFPWKNNLRLKEEFYPADEQQEQRLVERQVDNRKQGIRERRNHTYEPRFQCTTPKNRTTTTTTTTLPLSIQSTFEHYLYFIPEHKLLFCGIPKAGITEWRRFFRYTRGAQDYLSWPHFKRDLTPFRVSELTKEKQEELLTDPSWTKAVFLREPAERLLSGYLDKIVNEGWSEPVFGQNHTLSFAEFIELITTTKPKNNNKQQRPSPCKIPGLNTCTDPHFRPQLFLCGLDYLLPSFDFIGSFQHLPEHTQLLLKKVGMWDEYGSTYDDGRDGGLVGSNCHYPPPVRPSNFTPVGFNQGKNRTPTTLHVTQSSAKMNEYYTPELLATVRKAYHWDYAIWDDLVKRPSHTVASGNDLDIVRSYCSF